MSSRFAMVVLAGLVALAMPQSVNAEKTLSPEEMKQIEEKIEKCAKEAIEQSGLDVSVNCYVECKLTGWPPKLECKLKC